MENIQDTPEKRLTYKPLTDKIKTGDDFYYAQKYDEAIKVYNEVLNEIDESYKFNLGEIYKKIGDSYYYLKNNDLAREAYEKSLKYIDNNPTVYSMLAYLNYYSDSSVAIDYYAKSLKINPTDAGALATKCLTILKCDKYSQKQIKETFEEDIKAFRDIVMKDKTPYTYDYKFLAGKKKLHIGYMSSDYYCHAMMQFILPLLEHHNKERFNFTLYSSSSHSDHTTQRIKETGIEFKDVSKLSYVDLAKTIHDDNVDILVDLGGFTNCRYQALFLKPAPIIMQYLGFVNTLGISEVDYIFADEFTIPEDMKNNYTEKPLYLGTSMQRFTYNTKGMVLPDTDPLPYHKNGYFTFGSFNCTSKVSDTTIALWSKLLKEIENSKLLIYRTQMTPKIMEIFTEKFARHSIGKDRLIFDNKLPKKGHFKAYQMADIAVDTLPFNGLTITLELISMGIPVLTLYGDSMQSRGCARINKALGFENLVAKTEEEYIEKAKALVAKVNVLDYYRKNLRNILHSSYLMKDLDGFAMHVEDAYMKAWRACVGLWS